MSLRVKVLKWVNDHRKLVVTATKLAILALAATAMQTIADNGGEAIIQNRELDDEWG